MLKEKLNHEFVNQSELSRFSSLAGIFWDVEQPEVGGAMFDLTLLHSVNGCKGQSVCFPAVFALLTADHLDQVCSAMKTLQVKAEGGA